MKLLSILKQILKEAKEGIPADDPLAEIPAIEAPAPSEPSGEINLDTAKHLIFDTKGKIFTVVFIKKDGTERTMNARLGVKKYLRGGTLRFDAKEMGYIPVYDIQAKGYRMVNSNTILKLKIGGKTYTIPTAIAESREEHEMIVEYKDILNEIRIKSRPHNHLSKLLQLQSKIKSKDTPIEEKRKLALECAKLVLPIWEWYYPDDDRPRKAIEATERGDGNAADAVYAYSASNDVAANAAEYAAYAAASAAASAAVSAYVADVAINYVFDAADVAIEATKAFFKLNEIRIDPSPFMVGTKVKFIPEELEKAGFEDPIEYYKDLTGVVVSKKNNVNIRGIENLTDIITIKLNKPIIPFGGWDGPGEGIKDITLVRAHGDFDMIKRL